MPGIAKDQLAITIEGAVVRIASKEGAPRSYRAAYELPQEIDTVRQRSQAGKRRADSEAGQVGSGGQVHRTQHSVIQSESSGQRGLTSKA